MRHNGQYQKTRRFTRRLIRTFAGRVLAPLTAFSLVLTAGAAEIRATPDAANDAAYENHPEEGKNAREMAALWFGGADSQQDGVTLQGADGDSNYITPGARDALGEYFSIREADYPGGQASLLSRSARPPVSDAVLDASIPRANLIETMQDRLNINITDAVVTIVPESVTTEPDENGNLILYLCEWTFFDYDDLRDGEGGQDVTGYGTWHKITLAPDASGENYIILSDEYDESDILGLSTMEDGTRLEMQAAGYLPEYDNPDDFSEISDSSENINNNINNSGFDDFSAELQGIRYSVEYDVKDAIAYSEKYVWHGATGGRSYPEYYNLPTYENFNSIGGDCANFTSQAIKAGHMPEVISSNGWYYNSTTRARSVSWASSTNHRRWFSNNRGNLVEKLTTATEANIYPGSPVYYSTRQAGIYTHTVLCVGRNSAGRPIINSHNNDRWHALWNYYSSTATIDTVQLTSDNFFGSFQGYANPGQDFYAKIYNPNYARYAGADGSGNVIAEYWRDWKDGGDQIWHFERLDDGSYKITSARNENCMAVSGGGYLSRTPIATESYDGSSGQQWFLYDKFGGYLFRASCTDRVLDYPNGAEYEDGTPLWTFGRNDINGRTGIESQVFLLEFIDESEVPKESDEPEEPVIDSSGLGISFQPEQELNVIFSWDSVSNAASYHINITQDGHSFRTLPNVTDTSASFALDPGDYHITVTAYNASGRPVLIRNRDFTVLARTYTVSYDANGGSGAPASQIKTDGEELILSDRIPERQGYTFANWNTEQDGSGRTYRPNGSYLLNRQMTFYAQWRPESYTVTLHANGGAFPETTANLSDNETAVITVNYGGVYGEMPTPVRDDFNFLGWYADAQGGAEKIETNMPVTVSENHDLYARWEPVARPARISVTLDAAGGAVRLSDDQQASAQVRITAEFGAAYGASIGGALPTAVRPRYIFLGWFTELQDGTEITADTTVENQEPHTLYAHWQSERIPVVVTFVSFDASDQDGESPAEPVTKNVYYGEPYGELPDPDPHPDGRTFLGWFTAPEGGAASDTVNPDDPENPESGARITPESVVEQSEAHTLYARWEAPPKNIPILNSFVYQAVSGYLIRATFTDMPEDTILIAAGYRDGQLIAAVTQSVTNPTASAELRLIIPSRNPRPDKIKLFAIDKSGLPLCAASETPEAAFGRLT